MKEIIIAYDENTEASPVMGDWVGELVRCKDCRQGEQSILPNRHLWCRIHEFYREPEWYCADGERKSD